MKWMILSSLHFAKVVGFLLSIRILGGNTALKSHQGVSSLNGELVDIEY